MKNEEITNNVVRKIEHLGFKNLGNVTSNWLNDENYFFYGAELDPVKFEKYVNCLEEGKLKDIGLEYIEFFNYYREFRSPAKVKCLIDYNEKSSDMNFYFDVQKTKGKRNDSDWIKKMQKFLERYGYEKEGEKAQIQSIFSMEQAQNTISYAVLLITNDVKIDNLTKNFVELVLSSEIKKAIEETLEELDVIKG